MNHIWLENYQSGVPHEIKPDGFTSLVGLFESTCEKYAKNIAYRHYGESMTYHDVEQSSRYFATFLQQLNLTPGARVAIIIPNTLQYPIALFAILRAGYVVVNTNPLYTVDEWIYQLRDANVEAAIILSTMAASFAQALPKLPALKHVIITEFGDMFSPIKRSVINAFIKYIKYRNLKTTQHKFIKFRQALHTGKQSNLLPFTGNSDNIAFLQYTGGTTGISKGAMLTHRNMIANILQTAAWVSPMGLGVDDCIVTALPLYHIFSLTANCWLFFYLGASNLLITDPRNTKDLIKHIKHNPVTAITGVNTLFSSLINHKDWNTIDHSKFKLALSGGMALNENVANIWLQSTKRPLFEAYGLTEASPAVTINPLNLINYNGSIGLPLPSTEVSIRDEHGNELAIHAHGELCVRGPQVMHDYWQHTEEHNQSFWPDNFLRTGDRAYMDANGFIYLVDRIKDMIVISGFNVYPNEIEHVLQQIPGILEVGVIGVRLESGDEAIKACIVKKDPSLTTEEIIAYTKKHLTGYKIPKIIQFYSELPKSNVGKILRRALS